MKKFKKAIAVGLLMLCVCASVGCGRNDEKDQNDMAGESTPQTETTTDTNNTDDNSLLDGGNTNNNNMNNDSMDDDSLNNSVTDGNSTTSGNDATGAPSVSGALDEAGNAVGDVITDMGEGVKDVTDEVTGNNANNSSQTNNR